MELVFLKQDIERNIHRACLCVCLCVCLLKNFNLAYKMRNFSAGGAKLNRIVDHPAYLYSDSFKVTSLKVTMILNVKNLYSGIK